MTFLCATWKNVLYSLNEYANHFITKHHVLDFLSDCDRNQFYRCDKTFLCLLDYISHILHKAEFMSESSCLHLFGLLSMYLMKKTTKTFHHVRGYIKPPLQTVFLSKILEILIWSEHLSSSCLMKPSSLTYHNVSFMTIRLISMYKDIAFLQKTKCNIIITHVHSKTHVSAMYVTSHMYIQKHNACNIHAYM